VENSSPLQLRPLCHLRQRLLCILVLHANENSHHSNRSKQTRYMRGTVIRDGLVGFCEITEITSAPSLKEWRTPLQNEGGRGPLAPYTKLVSNKTFQ